MRGVLRLLSVVVLLTSALVFVPDVTATQTDIFVITGPSPVTAGVAHDYTITATSDGSATDTGFVGTVALTSVDTQMVVNTAPVFVAGVGTANITLKTAGPQTITATDNLNSENVGTSSAIVVNPADADHLVVTAPGSAAVGAAFTVTVAATDPFGNTDTGYLDTVHFTSSDGTAVLPPDHAFQPGDGGTKTFTNGVEFLSRGGGTQSVSVSDAGELSGSSGAITVAKGDQTITFAQPAGRRLDQTPYSLVGSASSGLAVAFTTETGPVCTNVGDTLALHAAGSCIVDANQAGDADWNPAGQVQRTILIGSGTQSITFAALPDLRLDESPFDLSATATSGLPVRFTSETNSVCSISSGTTVTLHIAGTCTIDADQDGTSNWSPASTVTRTFDVNKGDQTISFGALSGRRLDETPFGVSATATSGLAVTFTSSTLAVCTVSGATVTILTRGTCTIVAHQIGDVNWNLAPTVPQSFLVSKGNQTITFAAPGNKNFGDPDFSLTASASSGLTVTFSSETLPVCTVSGTTVTIVSNGSCTIDANQAGDSDWNLAPTVSRTFGVGPGSQTITFGVLADRRRDQTPFTVSATASSGLTVTFSSDTLPVCTVSGTTVTLHTAGTCTIVADQAGNGSTWDNAQTVPRSFTVTPGNQTVSMTSTQPSNAKVNGATYTPTGTATSGLDVAITIDASSTLVCSIDAGVVSFLATGTCRVNFDQAGDTNWNAAGQTHQSIAVARGDQTILITTPPPGSAVVGGPVYTPAATTPSGLTVAFTIAPSSSGVCSITGTDISFLGVGTCLVYANQAGDADWNPALQAQQSFSVDKGTPVVTFTSTAPAGAVVGGTPYSVTVTSPSPVAITLSINAGSASVCTITGNVVSFTAVGTCVVDADQAGNANWNAAATAPQTFSVDKGMPVITFTSTAPVLGVVHGPTYTVTATSPSPVAIVFTIDASATSVCNITGGTVVNFTAAGTCVIDANQAANTDWHAAVQVQQSFSVGTAAAPGAPTAVTGVAFDGSATISWTAPLSDGGASINAYHVTSVSTPFKTCSTTGTTTCTVMGLTNHDPYKFTVTATNSAGLTGPASAASATITPRKGASYMPITPTRVLDTFAHVGWSAPLGNRAPVTFQVTGLHPSDPTINIPAAATAVTGFLSVTRSTAQGYLALGPTATSTPGTSTLNFPVGDARSTGVTVPLSPTGSLSVVYVGTAGKTAEAMLDITGYFITGSSGYSYKTLEPTRILDSRKTLGNMSGGLTANLHRSFQVTGLATVPTSAVAVTGNLTVAYIGSAPTPSANWTKAGYVAIGPDPVDVPTTASIYFPARDNRGTGVTVKLGSGGTLSLVYVGPANAKVSVIFDVTGYFIPGVAGALYMPLTPNRILDSRKGASQKGLTGSLIARRGVSFNVTGQSSDVKLNVPSVPTEVVAVTGILTVTNQTAVGYLDLTPTRYAATTEPPTSTLNFPLNDIRATGVTVPLGWSPTGVGIQGVIYWAVAGKTTNVLFDVSGYFTK
jgi:hypothetical protein